MTTTTYATPTWFKFESILKGRKSRKVANNTYMEVLSDGSIGVRLHSTHVVVAHKDGSVTLTSGGWHTVTTRDRINRYAPVRMWSEKGVEYVTPEGSNQTHRFFDGMVLDSDGNVLNPLPLTEVEARDDEIKHLHTAIKKYARECGDRPVYPDNGDCWYCGLLYDAEKTTENYDHYLMHMEESYVNGSLIVNAMRERGWNDDQIALAFSQTVNGRSNMGKFWADDIAKEVRRYLSKRLTPERPLRG